MTKSRGYFSLVTAEGAIADEGDTVICGHCGLPIAITVGQLDTWSCKKCDAHLCEGCAGRLAKTLTCTPYEKTMERVESRDRFLRVLTG